MGILTLTKLLLEAAVSLFRPGPTLSREQERRARQIARGTLRPSA